MSANNGKQKKMKQTIIGGKAGVYEKHKSDV